MAQRTVKIERLSRKPINTKKGPAMKVSVKTGDHWLSCFEGPWNTGWKEGDTITVNVERKGDFLNIIPPPRDQQQAVASQDIHQKLDQIISILKTAFPGKGFDKVETREELPPPYRDDEAPPNEEDALPF